MTRCQTLVSRVLPRAELGVLGVVLAITVAQSIQSQLQVVHPGWIWNPALWLPGAYRVYSPGNIQKALQNVCLEGNKSNVHNDPLCLSRAEWSELRYFVVFLKKQSLRQVPNNTNNNPFFLFSCAFGMDCKTLAQVCYQVAIKTM
jgi:hypothetical protein